MRYRLNITTEAAGDLDRIGTYLAAEVPTFAVRFTERMTRAVSELGDRALRYALLPGHEQAGVRRRVVGSYNIYYRIRGDEVQVLHILHGARDADRILFPDED